MDIITVHNAAGAELGSISGLADAPTRDAAIVFLEAVHGPLFTFAPASRDTRSGTVAWSAVAGATTDQLAARLAGVDPLVIVLDGGLVQDVVSASDGEPYVVIDYDTDGMDDADLTVVPQGDDRISTAFVTCGVASEAHPHIAEFAAVFYAAQ